MKSPINGVAVALLLAIGTPAFADFGRQFYVERIDAISRMITIANRAAKSGDTRQYCLEVSTAGGVMGTFMSGLIKYFPETDWFEKKQKLRRTYREVGCHTSYGFGDF